MSIWKILGIDETDDIKKIKKAYAAKLKSCKPDEDPQGFQLLHESYKTAVKVVRYNKSHNSQVSQENEEPEALEREINDDESNNQLAVDTARQYEIVHLEEEAGEEHSSDSVMVNTEESVDDNGVSDEQLELDRLLKQVDELLTDEKQCNVIKSWGFITLSPYILYSEFNWYLGLGVLKRIADVSSVRNHTLSYLNTLFNWKDEEERIFEVIDDTWCKTVLQRIDNVAHQSDAVSGLRGTKSVKLADKALYSKLDYYFFSSDLKRVSAFGIDFLLLYCIVEILFSVCLLVFDDLLLVDISYLRVRIISILYFISAAYFELSSFQATPGKMALGLIVTDKNFIKVKKIRYFFRLISFFATLPGGIITILINRFLGNQYIHDRISSTYVIDLRKSKNEYNE